MLSRAFSCSPGLVDPTTLKIKNYTRRFKYNNTYNIYTEYKEPA